MRRAVAALLAAGLFAAGGAALPAAASPDGVPSSAASHPTDAVRDAEYWLDQYGIRSAWATTQGRGQTIAIIDTGVADVPDLAGAVAAGADFSHHGSPNGRTPVGIDADPEHGTLVASLAAGRGTGGASGVIGVAPQAKLLAISIGIGKKASDSDTQIAKAVKWAVDHGADVINMSLTRNTLDWPPSWDDAFLYAADHNVVVVAAAGNRGSGSDEVGAPATMPGVVVVGGLSRSGTASQNASAQGVTIAVTAPSEDLVGALPGGGYARWAGTSGAAPIVAGVVALIRAAHPGLDAANIIQRLIATAHDAGAKGHDPIYGYGVIDAAAAVRASVSSVTSNPLGSLADWVALNRRASSAPSPVIVAAAPDAAPTPVATPTDNGAAILLTWGPPILITGLVLVALAGLIAGAVTQYRSIKRERERAAKEPD